LSPTFKFPLPKPVAIPVIERPRRTDKIDVFVLSAFVDDSAQRGFEILRELPETNPKTRAVMPLDSPKPEA